MQRDIIEDVQRQAVLLPERLRGITVARAHAPGRPDGAGFHPLFSLASSFDGDL